MQQLQNKYRQLRRQFPFLAYENHTINYNGDKLQVKYLFNLADQVRFEPRFELKINNSWSKPSENKLLENLVFHIGMVEMISYWKASCPPKIIVRPYFLEPEAAGWWKKLFYSGLGEFFYTNGIEPDYNDFIDFEFTGTESLQKNAVATGDCNLLPLGGGKDSSVSLEILLKNHFPVVPFFLNPVTAALNVAKAAGFDESSYIIIHRTIDPTLLRLNEQGFLNGHTPFSALLAFYSLIPATLKGCRNIILSNESSANEPTIPGTNINHQYSKSYEFEKSFREYCIKYISDDLNYFSFLRPLNELQIAALFSGYKTYHQLFRSCNAGSKTGVWCGKCPKCLFTFIILSPFMKTEHLAQIFGSNLLDDPGLMFYFNQLCGTEEEKPFDCIGTLDEVNAALHETIRNYNGGKLPVLLNQYQGSPLFGNSSKSNFKELLSQFNQAHFIPEDLLNLLRTALDERLF